MIARRELRLLALCVLASVIGACGRVGYVYDELVEAPARDDRESETGPDASSLATEGSVPEGGAGVDASSLSAADSGMPLDASGGDSAPDGAGQDASLDAPLDASDTGLDASDAGPDGAVCVDDPPSAVLSGLCSLSSASPSLLGVTNGRCSAVALFWIDSSCDEIPYGVLQPQESANFSTFVSHPWVVRDVVSGELILEFLIETTTQVEVTVL